MWLVAKDGVQTGLSLTHHDPSLSKSATTRAAKLALVATVIAAISSGPPTAVFLGQAPHPFWSETVLFWRVQVCVQL